MEKELDDMTMQALDILEAGTSITEEQLNALKESKELRQAVHDLQDIKTAMQQSHGTIDVEERLRLFQQREKKTAPTPSIRPLLRYILPLAAAFIGILVLVTLFQNGKPVEEKSLTQDIVFTADEQQSGISLTNERGEQVALSPSTKQNSTITLDDFRRIFSQPENVERVTLNVPYGKSAAVALPDGSMAYLHPGSKVVFPTAFVGKQRVVMLEGCAYFKVEKDAEHPFVVMTDQLQTTVLGTEFEINSATGEVVLINGSVRVNKKEGSEEVVLKPGQLLTLHDAQFTVSETDIVPYEYWRDGYLYFDNVEVKDIMEAIGKNFNMTVEFRNTEAMHCRMRFITERNNGVDAAIEMMNRMKKVNVRKAGERIIVE